MAPEKTRLSKPPATLNGAYDAVRRMAKSAGPAALSGAYTTRVRGNAIDLAIAEATITIAIAAATAARAVAGTEPTETISRWDLKSLADYADEALLSAEAAYVATSSIRSTNSWFSRLLAWMLTSVVGLVAWPVAWFLNVFQASLFVRSSPGTSISSVVNTIIDAALTATASVDSTVDAAMTTTTTTTIVDSKPGAKAEPCRTRVVKVVPYDPCDAKRLYMAARIAQSTAAVATAAARAVWFSHPVLSLRARRAASVATSASLRATTARLTLLSAFSKGPSDVFGNEIRKWLAVAAQLESRTVLRKETDLYDLIGGAYALPYIARSGVNNMSEMIVFSLCWGWMFTTDHSLGGKRDDMSDDASSDASSVTRGVSPP